jgi:glucose/arabinose dehydrogenase
MSLLNSGRFGLAVIVAMVVASPGVAQAPVPPDCSGISDVSDFDGPGQSDFVGQLTTVRVASGLVQPTHAVSPPDGSDGPDDRLFIVEQPGTIRILDMPSGTLLPDAFLDIQTVVRDTGDEEGLLSISFHPDYNTPGAVNEGLFFVYYTNNDGDNQVSRFSVSADPDDALEASEQTVIVIDHPTFLNHNGGQTAFGPDGYLYLAPGDGGSACDPFGASQNINDLRGKMLRLNVDSFPPYSTAGNPFDGITPGLDEIWAYGLRNPWRFSFDRETGALYIADVGQRQFEEVNCQLSASTGEENYGWDFFEASDCDPDSCTINPTDCNTITHTKPVFEYSHARDGFSCSITGGYVYRGCRMTDLHGSYFYADYCSDQIRTFRTDAACGVSTEILRTTDLDPGPVLTIDSIVSFGEDSRGEVYICDRGGDVYKVLPEFDIMEVSAINAAPLSLDRNEFRWEDLQATSGHPVETYNVYRSTDDPAATFECLHQTTETFWTGGDPAVPRSGSTYFYLVTAYNAAGQQTRPGSRTDGTPRSVSSCPIL